MYASLDKFTYVLRYPFRTELLANHICGCPFSSASSRATMARNKNTQFDFYYVFRGPSAAIYYLCFFFLVSVAGGGAFIWASTMYFWFTSLPVSAIGTMLCYEAAIVPHRSVLDRWSLLHPVSKVEKTFLVPWMCSIVKSKHDRCMTNLWTFAKTCFG